ncbi:MAG: hypothetical protein HLX50_05790 [Alteromonadaceae bacterium]|nr:hypothetical protein [Alteromonadaceae bacterium]
MAIATALADARRVFLKEKRLPIRWVDRYQRVRYKKPLHRTLAGFTRLYAIPCDADASTELHMLTCVYDLDMAVAALKSLLRFKPPLAVVIHGDRTLNESHRAFLQTQIPGCRVILLSEADRAFATDPELAELRANIPGRFTLPNGYERQCAAWALKVLDFRTLARTDKVLVLDSDTLFLRAPDELLAWIASDGQRAFHSAPNAPNRQLSGEIIAEGFSSVNYPPAFNGGLFGYSRSVVTRELILDVLHTLMVHPQWPLYGDECIWRLILGGVPGDVLPFNRYPLLDYVGAENTHRVNFDEAAYVHFIVKHRGGCYQRIAKRVLKDMRRAGFK